jgi:hypothetical protein
MSSCCSTESESSSCSTSPKKRPCPVDGSQGVEVKAGTILHHLKTPWTHTLGEQKYYFCDNPACEVVYFGEDDSVIKTSEMREEIGQKRGDKDRLLCYCFGVTQGDAEADPAAREFVKQQTKLGVCACDSRNPSGRCCLKDFPK